MAKPKRGEKPRRLMTKVRRNVGKPTMIHTPKDYYDRNAFKRETEELIEKECTCLRMSCVCGAEEYNDDSVRRRGDSVGNA